MSTATLKQQSPRFRDLDAERAEARRASQETSRSRDLAWPEMPEIRLCAIGLQARERAFLDRMVAVSQHRDPRLSLLPRAQAHLADVVMIDGTDHMALDWSYGQDWLANRPVIWVNRESEHPGHTTVRRPIAWPMLQLLLANSIRRAPARPEGLATRAVQPDAPMVMVLAGEARDRHAMRVMLDAAGYRVTLSATAREGLAALHAGTYACVLLAGAVPDLDTFETCRRLRLLEPRIGRIPVLLMDREPNTLDRLKARMAGFDEVLPRPRRSRELKELLAPRIDAFTAEQRRRPRDSGAD